MPNSNQQHQKKSASKPARNLKRALLLTGVSACFVLLVLYIVYRPDPIVPPSASASIHSEVEKPNIPVMQDLKQLIGRWQRPDGGYILEIRSAAPDGKLEVSYFNPKSINVARAQWVQKDGKLYIMAELNDVNYPGSTYGLEYIVSADRLSGTYYQAVEKSTYDVQFVREK